MLRMNKAFLINTQYAITTAYHVGGPGLVAKAGLNFLSCFHLPNLGRQAAVVFTCAGPTEVSG